jgi:hypothetical protein
VVLNMRLLSQKRYVLRALHSSIERIKTRRTLDQRRSQKHSNHQYNKDTFNHISTRLGNSESLMRYAVELEKEELEYHVLRSACPSRNARRARTSVTYCRPSRRGTRCKRSLSVGSLIQPSIGIALSDTRLVRDRVTISSQKIKLTHPRGKYSSWDCYPGS